MIKWLSADNDWYIKEIVNKSSTGLKAQCQTAENKVPSAYTTAAIDA
jgi:hypothetical protein